MEGDCLARLERGERGRISPKVMHDRVEPHPPLTVLEGRLSKSAVHAGKLIITLLLRLTQDKKLLILFLISTNRGALRVLRLNSGSDDES